MRFLLGLCSVFYASYGFASDVWYQQTYDAAEQSSGCEIQHVLLFQEWSGSMQWQTSMVCSGGISTQEAVEFSLNALRTWDYALHKGLDIMGNPDFQGRYMLHQWQEAIELSLVSDSNLNGERHGPAIQLTNKKYLGEMSKPLLIPLGLDRPNESYSELVGKVRHIVSSAIPE